MRGSRSAQCSTNQVHACAHTGDLRTSTNVIEFRRFYTSMILTFKGWNSHVHREFPGNIESTNLSMDNLTMEIWVYLRKHVSTQALGGPTGCMGVRASGHASERADVSAMVLTASLDNTLCGGSQLAEPVTIDALVHICRRPSSAAEIRASWTVPQPATVNIIT